PPRPSLFPYTTLFRSSPVCRIWCNARLATMAGGLPGLGIVESGVIAAAGGRITYAGPERDLPASLRANAEVVDCEGRWITPGLRSEEHTSELQSRENL